MSTFPKHIGISLSPAEAEEFKRGARRMVYYAHEDGRMLLAEDSVCSSETPSDTPRPTPETDAQILPFTKKWWSADEQAVTADFARKLERERDEAREESLEQARLLGISGSKEAALLAENAALRADKARLDWLEENVEDAHMRIAVTNGQGLWTSLMSCDRKTIDRAMQEGRV